MKVINCIFKTVRGRVWFCVSAVVLAILIVATSLVTTAFRSIIGTVLGGKTPVFNENLEKIYESDYDSKNAVLEAGNALNEQIESEGATLLLNEENALPLARGSKVSVFGKNSVNLVLSGSGSGSGGSEGAATIFDGLEKGGLEYNRTLKEFYENN